MGINYWKKESLVCTLFPHVMMFIHRFPLSLFLSPIYPCLSHHISYFSRVSFSLYEKETIVYFMNKMMTIIVFIHPEQRLLSVPVLKTIKYFFA